MVTQGQLKKMIVVAKSNCDDEDTESGLLYLTVFPPSGKAINENIAGPNDLAGLQAWAERIGYMERIRGKESK